MKMRKKGRWLRNIGIWTWESKKGVGNGTENEGGRLGALLSTTACICCSMRYNAGLYDVYDGLLKVMV